MDAAQPRCGSEAPLQPARRLEATGADALLPVGPALSPRRDSPEAVSRTAFGAVLLASWGRLAPLRCPAPHSRPPRAPVMHSGGWAVAPSRCEPGPLPSSPLLPESLLEPPPGHSVDTLAPYGPTFSDPEPDGPAAQPSSKPCLNPEGRVPPSFPPHAPAGRPETPRLPSGATLPSVRGPAGSSCGPLPRLSQTLWKVPPSLASPGTVGTVRVSFNQGPQSLPG